MRRPERQHNHPQLKARRRRLRQHLTPAEARLWACLRRRQVAGRRFRRQHSIGPYVVDFYCPAERLAVELDGAPHEDPARCAYDNARTAFLERQGVRVARFENRRVFDGVHEVVEAIAACFDPEEHA